MYDSNFAGKYGLLSGFKNGSLRVTAITRKTEAQVGWKCNESLHLSSFCSVFSSFCCSFRFSCWEGARVSGEGAVKCIEKRIFAKGSTYRACLCAFRLENELTRTKVDDAGRVSCITAHQLPALVSKTTDDNGTAVFNAYEHEMWPGHRFINLVCDKGFLANWNCEAQEQQQRACERHVYHMATTDIGLLQILHEAWRYGSQGHSGDLPW